MKRKRTLSLVLSLCMVISLLPFPTLAAEKHPFTDVSASDWFNDSVQYVFEHGLMNGTGSTTFAPYRTTQRGMIVTILYRLEGSPAVTSVNPFNDVPRGSNYENAIIWAAANGIVTGYNSTTFGPYDNITRQQMAAISYRYAQMKGYRTDTSADLSEYTDSDRISSYARTAMAWANGEGLINGNSNKELMPTGNATRAQAAAILTRFCENVIPSGETIDDNPPPTVTYEVTFDLNYSGESTYQTLTVKEGDTVTAPTNPTRSGYNFNGWYTSATGGSQFKFNTAINADTTLYARWSRRSSGGGGGGGGGGSTTTYYTVTFNVNGGSVIPSQTIASGRVATRPADPTREGYTFGGWYSDNDLTIPYIFNTAISSNITLHAKWDNESEHRVTFESNGGSIVPSQSVADGELALQPTSPTKTGNTFVGWYTNEALTNLYNFNTPVTSNITLYARWTAEEEAIRTMLDDIDPDVEIYSFNIDTRSIPVGDSKVVTFTAEIFTNVELVTEDVSLMRQNDSRVDYMYDDGTHGDEAENDGIYTVQLTLSSESEEYDEYHVVAKDEVSESLGIGYYLPFADNELDAMEEVDEAIRARMSNDDFKDASDTEKSHMIISLLESLVNRGLIKAGSISYNENTKTYSYQYVSGVQGYIELRDDTQGLNSVSSNTYKDSGSFREEYFNSYDYGRLSHDYNDSQETAILADASRSKNALILNAFIVQDNSVNNTYRRVFYENLQAEWNQLGIHTTVDTDVTVADMKSLNSGSNDIIVFSMHGGHSGNDYALFLNEVSSQNTDQAYAYELRTRHTVFKYTEYDNNGNYLYTSYGLVHGFFSDTYSSTALQGKLIFSESCMFYGCDDGMTAQTPDTTLAQTLKGLSAGAVVGYHNSVGANYSREVMKTTIERAFSGDTLLAALTTARSRHGQNDNMLDAQDDKYIAYPIISQGDDQFMLIGSGIAAGTVRDATSNQSVKDALVRVYEDNTLKKSVRTDASGNYSIELPAGEYVIKVTAGHYKSAKMAVTVTENNTVYTETFLLLDVGLTIGYANGRITNAIVSGQGVSDVTIKMRLGWNNRRGIVLHTTTTNENGYYEISFIVGAYTIEYSKSGFVTGYKNILMGPIDLSAQNAVISPLTSEGVYRIVLSWRDHPSDLDSHLAGPLADGSRFHMFYPYADANNGSPYPDYVRLDLDNTRIRERSDPETSTIVQQLDGTYVYSVHDFSNAGDSSCTEMATSNATVVVYKGNTVVSTFHVPTNIAGTIWTVFELNGDTITPINRFGNGQDDDVALFDPYRGNTNQEQESNAEMNGSGNVKAEESAELEKAA